MDIISGHWVVLPWLRGFCLIFLIICYTSSSASYVLHPGRHVCMKKQHIQTPVKRVQSFCRPVYKKHVHRCESYGMCTSFRVVYQVAYREVYHMESHSQMMYSCCPGWTHYDPKLNGCMKPLCSPGCEHGGECIQPGSCKCKKGWTGHHCQEDVNECLKSPCQQRCVNLAGSFRCQCHSGFSLSEDAKTCQFCLTCVPEYKAMQDSYHVLQSKVGQLEKEKNQLQTNITTLERNYDKKITQLKEEVESVTMKPAPHDEAVTKAPPRGEHIPVHEGMQQASIDRLNSLSEQISLLEERMEMCECHERRP